MRTILENDGNKRYFVKCAEINAKVKSGTVHGFTVNVWMNRNYASYDAGFYVGNAERRRKADFHDGTYKKNVAYRVRVIPKAAALLPPLPVKKKRRGKYGRLTGRNS